jgi:predicted metal-dependent HD superfamily phosphohydrolase
VIPLATRFDEAFWSAGLPRPSPSAFEDLARRHAEPQRAYHVAVHLDEAFAWFDVVRRRCAHPGDVAIALCFHDAVYDPRAHDNEARSADLAASVLRSANASTATIERVTRLILATRHAAAPADADEAVLVDVDLSILGASAERFAEYEAQIRREYEWVDLAIYRRERARILQSFLARPRLFATDELHMRLDADARANLQRSIAALTTNG